MIAQSSGVSVCVVPLPDFPITSCVLTLGVSQADPRPSLSNECDEGLQLSTQDEAQSTELKFTLHHAPSLFCFSHSAAACTSVCQWEVGEDTHMESQIVHKYVTSTCEM